MSESKESDQVAQRRANFEALQRLGVNPYPHAFERTHSVRELVSAYSARTGDELTAERVETKTAGRILAIRSFGKANFIAISDGESLDPGLHPPGFGQRARLPDLQAARLWRLRRRRRVPLPHANQRADDPRLEARVPGQVFPAAAGEVARLERHRDPLPAALPRSDRQPRLAARVRGPQPGARAIRGFLNARGYLEVETPMMQPIPGGALARPFVTHHNTLDMQLFLRIAPELYLKRLTVGGIERVYEINRNFRNEGISTQHNPEFTMLEFYQAYSDYQALMVMTEEMISSVARESIGTDQITFGEHQISLAAPYRRVSLREGARKAASERLGVPVTDADLRDRETAADLARKLRLELHPGWGAGQNRDRNLRAAERARPRPADVRLRLPDRGLAPVEAEARRSRDCRALRALHRRLRGGQRLQRAERSGGAAPPLRGPADRPGRRRPRSARDGRGLHPRPRVRPPAHGRRGCRDRPARDAAHQQPVDPGCYSVSAHAEAGSS